MSVISLEPEPKGSSEIYTKVGVLEWAILAILRPFRFGLARHAGNRVWRQILVRAVTKYHRQYSIDLVLGVSLLHTPSKFAYQLWQRTGIPYVIQEHRTVYQRHYTDRSKAPRDVLAELDDASSVLALNERHAAHISNVTASPVAVMPLALPNAFFTHEAAPKSDETLTFGSWTNWRDFKRLDLLIGAFTKVADTLPRARLRVAGPIPRDQKTRVERTLKDASLADRVQLLGPLDRQGIKNLAEHTDILVVPSDHETFSIPASEALATGRPIIVTRCGGPETFVEEGKNGYSVPTNDEVALANAMKKAATRLSEFDAAWISKDARSKFSVASLSEKLEAVYGSLDMVESP